MRKTPFLVAFCLVAGAEVMAVAPLKAAEFTELLDAADDFDDFKESTLDKFDVNVETLFNYEMSAAKITREAPCVPSDASLTPVEQEYADAGRLLVDDGRCTNPTTLYNKEMLYRHRRAQLDIGLRAGLYKDLELRLDVPFVFDSTHGLKYANEDERGDGFVVDSSNSSVDPSSSRIQAHASSVFAPGGSAQDYLRAFESYTLYRFFELQDDYRNFSRAGFADPTLSLDWAPFNDERDATKATLRLGAGYQMPIAPIRRADNSAVGSGTHELQFRIRSSKRFDWIEPYLGFDYFLPLAATNSPLREYDVQNEGQVFTNPPQRAEITVGSEFIPYEDAKTGARYAIDLRFRMGYVSEGLNYTPLYEHMVNSACNGLTAEDITPEFDANGNVTNADQVACGWVVQRPGNASAAPVYDVSAMTSEERQQTTFSTDGMMTVEDHGTFAGLAGIYLQPSEFVQLKLIAQLEHRQEHFLTNSRTGKDTSDAVESTPDETVDLTGEDASLERNPVYNPSYDAAGGRFRVEEWNTWSLMFNAAVQF